MYFISYNDLLNIVKPFFIRKTLLSIEINTFIHDSSKYSGNLAIGVEGAFANELTPVRVCRVAFVVDPCWDSAECGRGDGSFSTISGECFMLCTLPALSPVRATDPLKFEIGVWILDV